MKNAHPFNQNLPESHLERAFGELKKTLSLSWSLREVIRAQVFEKIDYVMLEETSAVFDDLKHALVPQRSLVAQMKLNLMDRVEKQSSLSRTTRWERLFGSALGYGVSFLFVVSITSLFVVSNLQPSKAEYLGELQIRQGNAYIVRASNKFEVRSGEKLLAGDVIEVGDAGLVDINFYQQRQANLHSNTKVRIEKDFGDNSDIVLSLEKGKIEANASSQTSEPSLLTVSTAAGTVKAPESSAFVLEVDANSQKASLRVEQSEVELLAVDNTDDSKKNNTELVTSTVSSGEEKLLIASGEAITPETDPLIAFSARNEFRVESNQNANSHVTTKKTASSTKKATETQDKSTLELPQANEMSVLSAMRLSEIDSDLEIAKIKLKQLLAAETKDAPSYAEGYVQTVQRIADSLNSSNNPSSSLGANNKGVGDILSQSTLVKALNALPGLSKDLEGGDKNIAYQSAKQAIEELYTLESAVIIHSKLSEKETIVSLPSTNASTETLSTLRSIENGAGYNTKQKIEGAIESDILSRVDKVIAVEDRDTRAQLFTAILSSIPNAPRNIKLLETLQAKVPDDLKGYVHVKLHTIRSSLGQ